jgi:hypothetical protein
MSSPVLCDDLQLAWLGLVACLHLTPERLCDLQEDTETHDSSGCRANASSIKQHLTYYGRAPVAETNTPQCAKNSPKIQSSISKQLGQH